MVSKEYTPILKWKAAEQGALQELSDEQKDKVLPLLEFIRPTSVSAKAKETGITSPEDELIQLQTQSIPEDILKSWGDGRRFLADFTLITPDELKTEFANNFCKNAQSLYLNPIPVINLSDSDRYVDNILATSKRSTQGKLGIRINEAEIADTQRIDDFIDAILRNNICPERITVILDLKENIDANNFKTAAENLQKINKLGKFERVIMASGAFPKDMSKYSSSEDNHQTRYDWNNWNNLLSNKKIIRIPAFADYTIRHPIYDETTIKYRSTATIKYTLSDTWHILKGKVGEFSNCLAYASALKDHAEFYKAEFSAGDRYIKEKGDYFNEYTREKNKNPDKKIGGTGNAKQWIQAGINHHIAVVVSQISNLSC